MFTTIAQQIVVNTHSIGKEQGLSNTNNAFFYKDHFGFIWISSIDGLNRFDGRHIRVYKYDPTIPNTLYGSNIQSSFFEDDVGDIWFTTELAINCYHRKTDDFEHFFVTDHGRSLKDINCYAFDLDKDGHLWIIANNSYYIFNTHSPGADSHSISTDTTLACRAALALVPDRQKKIILGCFWENGSGFESLELDQNDLVKSKNTYPRSPNDFIQHPVKVTGVQLISEAEAWLSTNKGLVRYNPSLPEQSVRYPVKGDYSGVIDVKQYDKNTLFAISRSAEILPFDKNEQSYGSPVLRYDRSNNFINPLKALNIWIDQDRVLWTSDNLAGITYGNLQKNGFQQAYKCQNGQTLFNTQLFEDKNGQIWCLPEDGNGLIIGRNGKINSIHLPESSKMYRTAGQKQHLFVPNTTLPAKNKFLAAFDHVFCYPSLPAAYYGFAHLNEEYDLMGTFSKLFYLRNDGSRPLQVNNIKHDVFQLFADEQGLVWLGGGDQIEVYEVGKDMKFRLIKTFPNTGLILHFYKDTQKSDRLWAATPNGLIELNLHTLSCTTITEQSGFPNQYVYAVTRDSKGYLWLSTNQGIISFNPDIKPYRFKQYTTRDGLSSNEFNPGAVLTDSRGYIWFGSTKGIDVFHPDSIHDIGHPPLLAIVGLKVHDREWQGDSAIEVVQQIDLPYNRNTLRLELAAMEYLDPDYNKFKVMLHLEGENTTWTDLGTQNFVTYANLKPGRYTFRFIACNAEGIWTEEKNARVLRIDIHPHWSDTWWFRSLIAALLLAFVTAVTAFYYRYRLRAKQIELEKQQRETERQRMELEKTATLADSRRKIAESEMKLLRAQLNPHFLFNAMNSINRYILSNERDKASEYLGQFAQLTRSILDNSRNLSIPLADELKMLHQYLALENHRFQQNIHWTFTISPDIDEENLLVPSMLLQPFTENAVLHGLAPKNGGHIAVEISRHDDSLQCIIRDDGAGRNIAPGSGDKSRHASAGMRLITERIDAFAEIENQSATFAIIDLKDAEGNPAGTEVVIRLPWVEAI